MDLKDGLYAEVVNLYSHWKNMDGTNNVMLMDDVAPYPKPIQLKVDENNMHYVN